MDALVLYYREEALREFPLEEGLLEVGRGPGCDIVVHDPEVADRHLVVRREGGTVVAYSLGRRGGGPRHLPLNDPLPLGRHHALVRIADAVERPRRATPCTDPVSRLAHRPEPVVLLVGRGSEARRACLDRGPLQVGSGPDNDLVLADRTVSSAHCRIDPWPGGGRVCDLGSRNGTWVDGVRVTVARVGPGSHVRVGRTDLCLVARGGPGDARRDGLVAVSPGMLAVLGEVERAARLSWPVLVLGESGSGKELVARALHARGPRAAAPFVAVNAGGLPRHLVETELFGHERGAFTGAVGAHRGLFEQADGGTLFLDEVGELPLELQARLLRVLERWEVRRVGGEGSTSVDVRVVCATHRDLLAMVGTGGFRQDLFYRLTRLVIEVPPLRSRPEEVEALAKVFLSEIEAEVGHRRLSEAALARLMSHDWPGNVRELRNVVSAAAAGSPGQVLQSMDVERALCRLVGPERAWATTESLLAVVESHGGNIAAAARAMGVPRSTLRDRIRCAWKGRPGRPADEPAAGRGTSG